MNQTLRHYQHIKQNESARNDLGCALPTLSAASLVIRSELCTADELVQRLAPWYKASGWYQTSSCTALGMPDKVADLLEGEWHDGTTSLSVRLLGPNQYQVTELERQEDDTSEQYCYQEQTIWLRGDLCSESLNAILYRQWFEQKDHAWQAVASQFVGFTFIEEQ